MLRKITHYLIILSFFFEFKTSAQSLKTVRIGYKRPFITVPYAWKKPKIDGIVNDNEWIGAESTRALQTTGGSVSIRQTRFWMMWDEDNLYLAMRSPLRKGERVIQSIRKRDRDYNVVFDDSYEIWLDVNNRDPKTGLKCFYQFLCNYAGARWDTIHLPSVGNSRLTENFGWEPQNRITKNNEWEWELVIPRKSIGLKNKFQNNFSFACLIARNYKRPWQQNSFEGTSAFNATDSYSKFTLSKTAPAIHLEAVSNANLRTFGLKFSVYGQKNGKGKYIFRSDRGIIEEGIFNIYKNKLSKVIDKLQLDKEGKGYFRVTVSSQNGKDIFLDWSSKRQFGNKANIIKKILSDRGDVVNIKSIFNPIHNYLRISGDFINYDNRNNIDKIKVVVLDKNNKQLANTELKINKLAYGEALIKFKKITFGKYTVQLTALDKRGKKILTKVDKFEKKDPEKSFLWWNTKRGNIEKVISPWTPVGYKNNVFRVWGRTMKIGVAGLPSQITALKRKLLAGPSRIIAEFEDNKKLNAVNKKIKTTFKKNYRTIVRVNSQIKNLKIDSNVQVEFDGMYKITMKITPETPVKLKSLKIIIPFANQTANYIHAVGEGIRTGFYYGFLPKNKKGQLWNCLTVDSQPMKKGSFIPYVWIGSPKGGLAWFADSDFGWVPNNKVPAIEIRRTNNKSTDLILNLISEPFIFDKPRTITFAFQATPVKPMHDKWRMDSWWCGDSFVNYSKTDHVIWTSIPYAVDVEKSKKTVAAQHKVNNAYIFGINKYRQNAVPYFIHQSLPAKFVPEMKYFGEQWRTAYSDCLYYGKTLTDYMVYNYGKWAEETGIDGYYIDNMRPVACNNIDAGRGYRLSNGDIQPSYQMFSTRRYFLRSRAAFLEAGRVPKMVLHMTNSMISPWVGAADVAYDGEHHVIYPEMGKDFMDFWSLERMRIDFSGQWGVAFNFMQEYQGNWTPNVLCKAMRAYTGMVILHDALPSGNSNGLNTPLWIGRDRFGIETKDVKFIPYWEKKSGLESKNKNIYLAGWLKPGKLLVAVVNRGEKTIARVKINAKKLGLPVASKWKVWDAEKNTAVKRNVAHGGDKKIEGWFSSSQKPIIYKGNGIIEVPVERHDYRQIIIEKKKE